MSDLIRATWTGPAGCKLPDGTELVPGETVAEVSAGEARISENWQPVEEHHRKHAAKPAAEKGE